MNYDPADLDPRINAARIGDRTVDELLGICKGMIADGEINKKEANYLNAWLIANREYSDSWIVQRINKRVTEMLSDGSVTSSERKELFQLLSKISSDLPLAVQVANFSTSLPLDVPAPSIVFNDKVYCLTGQFAYAPRLFCEKEIIQRGGIIKTTISKKIHYLVIGTIGSRDWKHSSYGLKIEKAMGLKDAGVGLHIINEDTWVAAL